MIQSELKNKAPLEGAFDEDRMPSSLGVLDDGILTLIGSENRAQDEYTDQELIEICARRKCKTIKQHAEAMLLLTTEVDGHPVGAIKYPQILRVIRHLFPAAKTRIASLRWYAVNLRYNSDDSVPYRRRSAPHSGDGS